MNELAAIIKYQAETKKKTALLTVVHVDGSSYRRPGARMLITDEGEMTGAISGGCLEGDALRKALLAIHTGKAMLVTYDTSDEEDAKLGLGLGCNGIIQVLIEPVDLTKSENPVNLLKLATDGRRPVVIVTLFSLRDKKGFQPGTCLVLKEDTGIGNVPAFNDSIFRDARESLASGKTVFKNYLSEKDNYTAFIEYRAAPISLVITGAGNDVIPLVQMAELLGWQTTVIDGRPLYAKKERFTSSCTVMVSKPENSLEQIVIDDRTVFLLMTHNYNYDLAMLRALLTKNVSYIGSLGPRKKLDRMLNELRDEGIVIREDQLCRIYGPVGLDIGAGNPEEIALSILAEIKAVFSNKKGNPLRDLDVIHPRANSRIEEVRVKN